MVNLPLLFGHQPLALLLSWLVTVHLWLGLMLLRHRLLQAEAPVRGVWMAGGTLFLGFGLWAFHFIGMLGWRPGLELAFSGRLTLVSLLFAVVAAWPLLHAVGSAPQGLARWRAKLGFAGGLAAMHYVGVYAAETAPGPQWQTAWILLSALLAVALAVGAVAAPAWCDAARGYRRRWQRRLGVAAGLGLLLVAVHHAGVAGAQFMPGTVCRTEGLLSGAQLTGLVAVAAMLGLGLLVWLSIGDARAQTRAHRLAAVLQQRAERAEHRVLFDPISGLPTRAALDAEIARLHPGQQTGAGLVHLELDGYQTVCDSWGQQVANALIRQAGGRIAELLPGGAQLAHAGNEQFLILMRAPPPAAELQRQLNALACALRRPFQSGPHSVSLASHFGVAIAESPADLPQLMAMARSASDYARRAGTTWRRFEPHMLGDARQALALQAALRQALERNELSLAFQPKVAAATGACVGHEALLRWRHPQLGAVSPAVFIPVAERYGLMADIGQWVLDEAIRTLAHWRTQGLTLPMSVNLSIQQLEDDGFVERLQQTLQAHGVAARQLVLEVTESATMLRPSVTRAQLQHLRALGVELAIDDFGTGYSSLSYLHTLPVSELKLDRSFTAALDAGSLPIVEAAVRMARAFGMRVVAEGVETAAQRERLTACGCDQLQGFLFARPMPATEVLARLAPASAPAPAAPSALGAAGVLQLRVARP